MTIRVKVCKSLRDKKYRDLAGTGLYLLCRGLRPENTDFSEEKQVYSINLTKEGEDFLNIVEGEFPDKSTVFNTALRLVSENYENYQTCKI